jgi:hypothetical protein
MRKSFILVALACLLPATAMAQQDEPAPPLQAWTVLATYPFDGTLDAPLNGVQTVTLAFGSEPQWPEDEVIAETVVLRLTRAEDEEVEGTFAIHRDVSEVSFETAFPLAEGIEYTLHVELKNSFWGSGDETYTAVFTTGNRFDEAQPAFSGLQSLGVTEHAEAVNECCEANEEQCGGLPRDRCQWCWIVDWNYLPQVDLNFRAVDDEFGYQSLKYLIYRLDGPDSLPEGPPQVIRREQMAGDQVVHLVNRDPGPWCYLVRAVDVWGRDDGNTTVLCGSVEDIVPIDRLEVPPEDRSFCADQGGEPEEDVGGNNGADVGNDLAVGEDVGSGDDVANPIAEQPEDSGCGCETPTRSASWRWLLRR